MNSIKDPGFGEKMGARTKRIINKDGSFNIVRIGGAGRLQEVYQFLLHISNFYFFILILISYVLFCTLFAVMFFAIDTEHFTGIKGETLIGNFLDCFYFSTQTFTTVGYGAIAPRGTLASTVASFEALNSYEPVG